MEWMGTCFHGWSHLFVDAHSQWLSEVSGLDGVATIHFGVPQDSVLDPLLYVLFTADIPQIIQSSGLNAHQYADDVQVYVHSGTDSILQWSLATRFCM